MPRRTTGCSGERHLDRPRHVEPLCLAGTVVGLAVEIGRPVSCGATLCEIKG
ncbi:hypothetical protein ACGFYU_16730 [Streptomyces sp. NPDC048337]|uniref:hypothetical protein n=1 Tax=Streptomyces sp. NPDC048337 TaxID=3365535 RepID=UPI00370F77EB